MSSPAVEALRAELIAARDLLPPQLRGLRNMSNDPFSPEAVDALNKRIGVVDHRLTVINSTLARLDELDADGYPELPPFEVSTSVLQEFELKETDVGKAVDGFSATPEATSLDVNLGDQPTS